MTENDFIQKANAQFNCRLPAGMDEEIALPRAENIVITCKLIVLARNYGVTFTAKRVEVSKTLVSMWARGNRPVHPRNYEKINKMWSERGRFCEAKEKQDAKRLNKLNRSSFGEINPKG